MFTGLIEDMGIIQRSDVSGSGRRFLFGTTLVGGSTGVGDSIAVNGVCLTVTQIADGGFLADASSETLMRSNLGNLRVGQKVNLERALRVGDRLDGHFVTGHIDCTASVAGIYRDNQTVGMDILMPGDFMKYVAAKGSIAVDGVSLTVNHIAKDRFGIRLIPHTLSRTTLQYLRPGEPVNIETDIIAKYLERLSGGMKTDQENQRIDLDFLAKHGFS